MWILSFLNLAFAEEVPNKNVTLNTEAKALTPDAIQLELMLSELAIAPKHTAYIERQQNDGFAELNWIRLDGNIITPNIIKIDKKEHCTRLSGHDPVQQIRQLHHIRGSKSNTGLYVASKDDQPQAMVHLEPGEQIIVTTIISEDKPAEEHIELNRTESRLILKRNGDGVETCSPH